MGERVGHSAKPAAHIQDMRIGLQTCQLDEEAKECVGDSKEIATAHDVNVFLSGDRENRFDEVNQNASLLLTGQRSE